MDKYELSIREEKIRRQAEKKDYASAAKIADTIDWRRVRNVKMLTLVSQIYEKVKDYEAAKEVLLIAYERVPVGRRMLYKLTELSVKAGSIDEAEDFLAEFQELAPGDSSRLILTYMIEQAKGAPVDKLITILELYKDREFEEKWAYELALLYHKAGRRSDCVDLCNKIILWFSVGTYVDKAMDLKMQYEPLSPSQQEKFLNKKKYEDKIKAVEMEMAGGKPAAPEPEPEPEPDEIHPVVDLGDTTEFLKDVAAQIAATVSGTMEEPAKGPASEPVTEPVPPLEDTAPIEPDPEEELPSEEAVLDATGEMPEPSICTEPAMEQETGEELPETVETVDTADEVPAQPGEEPMEEPAGETDEEPADGSAEEPARGSAEEPAGESKEEPVIGSGSGSRLEAALEEPTEEIFTGQGTDTGSAARSASAQETDKTVSLDNTIPIHGADNTAAPADEETEKTPYEAEDTLVIDTLYEVTCVVVVEDDIPERLQTALDTIKKTHEILGSKTVQAAKISSVKLSQRGVKNAFLKAQDRDIIIDMAADLTSSAVAELVAEIRDPGMSRVVVLVDSHDRMEQLLTENPQLDEYCVFLEEDKSMSPQELVDYASDYAFAEECKIDASGRRALLDKAQRMADQGEQLSEQTARDLVEDAIAKAEHRGIRGIFSSRYDKEGYLILKEQFF